MGEAREHSVKANAFWSVGRTVCACLIPFAIFLVLDGWFYSSPFNAEHFGASIIFSFAPVVCLYLGWPAIVGCAAAEAVVCLSTQVTVFDPALWLAGVVIYVALPYVLWYLIFWRAEDPYPRFDRASSVAWALVLLFISALVFGFLAGASAATANPDNGYAWAVIDLLMPMSAITLTVGIVLGILFEASPIAPRAPLWIREPYRQRPMLSLTQRIVFVFAVLAAVTVLGLLAGFMAFVYDPSDPDADFLSIMMGSLLIGDVVIFILWIFAIFTIAYIQSRFTMPIERLSAATRAFPEEMGAYQRAEEEDAAPDVLAEAKARAAQPVDMSGLRPSGEAAYLVEDTDTMRAELVRYLDEMRSVTAENERVRAELDIASQIQQGAVPHDFAELDRELHVQVAASMFPARDVGGDFYDAFRVDGTHLGVIMADVSGKGMPAALFMMRALADLREQMHAHAGDVGLALTRANRALCENNDAMLFVTGFIGILDVESGVLSYANAGHNPAWRLGPEGTWLKARKGLVLGVMDAVSYRAETLRLSPGGGLFLYTDGVTEAMDAHGGLYGDPRLDEVLRGLEERDAGDAPAGALVDGVIADVRRHAEGAEQSDDITALAFRWLPEG